MIKRFCDMCESEIEHLIRIDYTVKGIRYIDDRLSLWRESKDMCVVCATNFLGKDLIDKIVEKDAEEKAEISRNTINEDITLKSGIEDLCLSARSFNCLRRDCIFTVGDLLAKTDDDLMKVRNLGKKAFEELTKVRVMYDFLKEQKNEKTEVPARQIEKLLMAKYRVPKTLLEQYRYACCDKAVQDGHDIKANRLYTLLALVAHDHLHFGIKRTQALLNAYSERYEAFVMNNESWHHLMQECRDKTGIIIRTGEEDDEVYEFKEDS